MALPPGSFRIDGCEALSDETNRLPVVSTILAVLLELDLRKWSIDGLLWHKNVGESIKPTYFPWIHIQEVPESLDKFQ